MKVKLLVALVYMPMIQKHVVVMDFVRALIRANAEKDSMVKTVKLVLVGQLSNQSTVCSGHGNCYGLNYCECFSTDYSGLNCEIPTCFEITGNNPLACSRLFLSCSHCSP